MDLEEKAVGAEGLCCQSHGGNEAAVAARGAVARARALHAVGAVHDNTRGYFEHVANVAEVDNQVVVAIHVAALREPHVLGTCLAGFLNGVDHVLAAQKLRLLDVYRAACLGGRHEQVGLAAEEGRNLDDVNNLSHGFGLTALVDVGKNFQTKLLLYVGKHLKTLLQPGAAERVDGCAVGLVKRGFKYNVGTQPFVYVAYGCCHVGKQLGALYNTRASNE